MSDCNMASLYKFWSHCQAVTGQSPSYWTEQQNAEENIGVNVHQHSHHYPATTEMKRLGNVVTNFAVILYRNS